ncbi:MAG: YceI family protein [Saprospiraceae bacterium]|nr:YceI family protein [Saprospiraceae bacterium]
MVTLLLLLSILNLNTAGQTWKCQKGKIEFNSNAPLEVINAKSAELKGIIDPATSGFAFSVKNSSFRGFNSALQEEHFHESYMESHRYDVSSFTGKIIEKIDFSKSGIYTIRAKGKLNVHGVERERIIQSTIQVNGQQMSVKSTFSVPLAEHNISIPKLVHQKIAEEIQVKINADFVFQ